MTNPDWRLQGQEKYLLGVALEYRRWVAMRAGRKKGGHSGLFEDSTTLEEMLFRMSPFSRPVSPSA